MNKTEILRQIVEIEAGIVPSSVWFSEKGSVNDQRWDSLSDDQKRILKRKFRKLFRKACRKFGIKYSEVHSASAKNKIVSRYIQSDFKRSKLLNN